MVKSRRAIGNLQCSPKGKHIAGLSPRKITFVAGRVKKSDDATISLFNLSRAKRNSISLPNIAAAASATAIATAINSPSKVQWDCATTEMAVQCNMVDEDLLYADNVDDTAYWRMLARKQHAPLVEAVHENAKLYEFSLELDKTNKQLGYRNAVLNELVNGLLAIKVSFLLFQHVILCLLVKYICAILILHFCQVTERGPVHVHHH